MNPETPGPGVSSYLTLQVGQISLGPAETVVLCTALGAALLSALTLWRIGKQEDRRDRLAALRGTALDAAEPGRVRPSSWYRRLGSLVAASPIVGTVEQQRLLGALAAAGLRGHGSLASFVASKLCGALATGALTWLLLNWQTWFAGAAMRLAVLVGGLMLGWRLPDLVLARLAARRRLRIEQGMPDALDLLVICAEAGLSLNQAIEQVSYEMQPSNPEVAEELAATAAEMRVLPDLGQALDNLGQRSGVAMLRGVIATLKQSLKFGTPLAESLRILATEMRNERILSMEERAARLPVLLSLPLALFILPCLLMIIATPVALRVIDVFSKASGGQ